MASMGRPRVEWTASRQRKLARLYLCTDMKLEDICEALQDGDFQPKYADARLQGLNEADL